MDAVRAAHSPAPLSHAEIRRIVLGVMLAMFLAALDQTIVATALPTIGRELHNVADLPWVEIDFPEDLEHARDEVWPAIAGLDVAQPGCVARAAVGQEESVREVLR